MSRRPRHLLTLFTTALLLAALPAGPAAAEAACTEDDVADVDDLNTSDTESLDVPNADIVAVCASYDQTHLEVTVRLGAPSDPATEERWDEQRTVIGVAVDTDGQGADEEGSDAVPGGEEININLGRFLIDQDGNYGPPQTRVFIAGTNTETTDGDTECIFPALYDDTRFRVRVPVGCLDDHPDDPPGAPATVRVAAFMISAGSLEQETAGLFDEVPEFPSYLTALSSEPPPDTVVERLAGLARVDTANQISGDDFEPGTAGAVVLALADNFPDALAAAPLAVAVNGPLLLTTTTAVPGSVLAEIQRVLPSGGTVYLSGGTAVIAESVATQLTDAGYAIQRAAGPTRYATSVEVARAAVEDPGLIVVANGNDFPDALVGGALAAAEGGVQVLSNGEQLDDTAQQYLAEHADAEVVAVGSTAAAAVPGATALAGENPFATSVAVAGRYGDVDEVALASGTNFPDGLAGGAHAGRARVPLLLSWPDVLADEVDAYLAEQAPLSGIVMYGGTVALSYGVESAAAPAIG